MDHHFLLPCTVLAFTKPIFAHTHGTHLGREPRLTALQNVPCISRTAGVCLVLVGVVRQIHLM